MSEQLKFRKPLKLLFSPFMFFATILVWLMFDITWEQAKKGEL